MALKIWKDGAMAKIDTNLHKPVIFINGTKYKLDKAYTFVNGVKKELWGASGVQVDYISSTGIFAGGDVFAIGEDWANVYHNFNIRRLDISNLSSPSLIQGVSWGNIIEYNNLFSNEYNTMEFVSATNQYSGTNRTFNLLEINNGEITVKKSKILTRRSGGYLGWINDSVFQYEMQKTSTSSTTQYGAKIYSDNTLKYTIGTTGNKLYPSDRFNYKAYLDNKAILPLIGGTDKGIYSLDNSAYTKISSETWGGSTNYDTLLYDNDRSVLLRGWFDSIGVAGAKNTALATYDPVSLTLIYKYQEPFGDSESRFLKLVGTNDDGILILSIPYDTNATSGVKLKLLDTDMTVILEKDLPADPFNENGGKITFWFNCNAIPQCSKTGFLGVSTYNSSTLDLRIARFSGLI